MVVRIDDVNPNTDWEELYKQIEMLCDVFDEIILGVNLFSKASDNGAIHPELPLRGHKQQYFYNVDRMVNMEILNKLAEIPKVKIVSHGLVHAYHSKMSVDAIEMSVITSCRYLNTSKFIPPFNDIGQDLEDVCQRNGIQIIRNGDGVEWRTLESGLFDRTHKYWYYHPWRMTTEKLTKHIGVCV